MLRSEQRSFVHRVVALVIVASSAFVIPAGCDSIDVQSRSPIEAPVYGLPADGTTKSNIVPDQYIVVLDHGTSVKSRDVVRKDIQALGGEILYTFDSDVLQGFLAHIPRPALEQVQRMHEIAWIEADMYGDRTGVQTCAPWNLDMLDHQSPKGATINPATMLDHVYSYSGTGKGVKVLVVDTGLRKSEFADSQVILDGFTLFPKMCDSDDLHGHGTMVAAVIAGKTTGVAKNAKVIGYNAANLSSCYYEYVEPLDPLQGKTCGPVCTATCPLDPLLSDDVKALEDISMKIGETDLPKGTIIVLPHAFDKLKDEASSLEAHVKAIVNKGGIFVTGSGNPSVVAGSGLSRDACDFTPARLSDDQEFGHGIITVGGMTPDGSVGLFNSGPCVDLFAPGTGVHTRRPEATCDGPGGGTIESGTSYAAAHVAGVAALLLEKGIGIEQFKNSLLGEATRIMNVTDGLPGSPNLVLHNRYNVGESGNLNGPLDEDGSADIIKLCQGADCFMCNLDDGKNPCNVAAPPLECTARMRCTGTECARCGQAADRCCNGPPSCEGSLVCESGFCGCGDKDEACCNDAASPCNTDALVCKDQKCVECGVVGSPCCAKGECFASDLQCLDGTCQTCDAVGSPCCVEAGNSYCVGNDLQCVGGKCSACGKSGAACCQSANGPYCVSAGLSCINNTCTGCGALNEACCVGAVGPYCAGFDMQCDNGTCKNCGSTGQDCCVDANGSYCLGAGVSCLNNVCLSCGTTNNFCCVNDGQTSCYGNDLQCMSGLCKKCGGQGEPCCAGDGQPYCVGAELNCYETASGGVCTSCGAPNTPCCPDMSCATSDMACVEGTCRASCTARCVKGQLVQTPDEAWTASACVAWAASKCGSEGFGLRARVFFNGSVAFNLDAEFPGACGGIGKYCCYDDDVDEDGIDNECDNNPMNLVNKCRHFPVPQGAIGNQRCDTCGYSGAACCSGGECALNLNCTAGTCQPPP